MADPNHVAVPDKGVVFVLPHKSACTSIKAALKRVFGVKRDDHPHDFEPDDCLCYMDLDDVPPDWLVVGAIREPWARLVSGFRHMIGLTHKRIKTPAQLEAHLRLPRHEQDVHLRAQSYDYAQRWPDRWLCVERLMPDWQKLCADLRWPLTKMPHLNQNQQSDYPELTAYRTTLLMYLGDDGETYDKIFYS